MEVARQVLIPTITSWQDFVAAIGKVDFLIASRLHSAILGFITQTPTVAISFDPKVDWLMEDLGMTECLLQIEDFSADDVIQVLDRLMLCRDAVLERIASYRDAVLPIFARQYDALAGLARQQPCR
jgi:polysaccharide pyruvyl transferase WcaK-like protein